MGRSSFVGCRGGCDWSGGGMEEQWSTTITLRHRRELNLLQMGETREADKMTRTPAFYL